MRGRIVFDARLRPTSSAESLPWLAKVVTLLRVGGDGVVTQAKTDAEKRAMLGAAEDRDLLVVAWPGEWSQDLFVVDDLPAARLALGLPRRRVVPTAPAEVHREPRSEVDWSAGDSRDLWGRLAELPDLSAEGKRQLVEKAVRWISAREIKPLLARSDLDQETRQRLLAGLHWWDAVDIVADDCCTAEEALELLGRFPAQASVLGTALRRADIGQAAMLGVAALSYGDAAELWLDSKSWSAPAKAQLASVIVGMVLGPEGPDPLPETPSPRDRHEPNALIRGLINALSASRRVELLRDPEHGARVRRAFLAAEDLADSELLECLPELETAQAADLLGYLRRFPRLGELARDETGAAVARMITDGWDPVRAARAGAWADLAVAAGAANTPDCVDALIRAVAVESQSSRRLDRHRFVDAILGNAVTSSVQIRSVLESLPDEHIRDVEEVLSARSRTRRLCAEVLTARQRPRTVTSAKPAPAAAALPTDEELAALEDPAAALADLLRDRSGNRDAVVAHVLGSVHLADELAWRLPVRALERHPVYGPRLAAKVAGICGDSTGCWQAFDAAWRTQTQLLATSLFKRIEAGRD